MRNHVVWWRKHIIPGRRNSRAKALRRGPFTVVAQQAGSDTGKTDVGQEEGRVSGLG